MLVEIGQSSDRATETVCESHTIWSHPSRKRQSYAEQFEITLWGGLLSLWTYTPGEERVKCHLATNTPRWAFAHSVIVLEYTRSGRPRWRRLSTCISDCPTYILSSNP